MQLDGSNYEGEWLHNRANGFGVFVSSEGEKYKGEWRKDLPHGKGV